MAIDKPHPTSLLTEEERAKFSNTTLFVGSIGFFSTILFGFVTLSVQWRRLKSARQRRREQQEEEHHLNKASNEFSTEKLGGEIRGKHKKEYKELAAQLNDMKKMQHDVKSQLAGLQTLASQLSERKKKSSTCNNNQTTPPTGSKKQN